MPLLTLTKEVQTFIRAREALRPRLLQLRSVMMSEPSLTITYENS